MAANLKESYQHLYTLEEYFALEKTGDARYEYWDGEIVCMSGGSRQHLLIGYNIQSTLVKRLDGSKCRAFSGELPIKTPQIPPYRYPDVSVLCGEPVFENINGIDVATNPTILVEVLSPATERADRKEKRLAYQALPSVREYLLVAQDELHIVCFTRQGNFWPRQDFANINDVVVLSSINCQLTLAEIYEGIVFE
jgi:Uma2 family endonuclease